MNGEVQFQDPKTRVPLFIKNKNGQFVLVDQTGQIEYPIIDGIVRFLGAEDIQGKNKRYEQLYNKIAWFYDLSQRFIVWLVYRRKVDPFKKFFDALSITPESAVLEVSIGTGHKMDVVPPQALYAGVDISLGMITRCRKNCVRKNRIVALAHANAEELPFADNSFDVVFHVGGINFFSDKESAVKEMLRVAKPGARILISDETEFAAKRAEKWPIAKKFFKDRDEVIVPPIELVKKYGGRDINLEFIGNNELYVVICTKTKD